MKSVLILFLLFFASCGVVPLGQRYDNHIDGFIRASIKEDIQSEVIGLRPPGGVSTWSRSWQMQIEALADTGTAQDRAHISYIIQERRKAGLPEL
jgi:hypothetical protein